MTEEYRAYLARKQVSPPIVSEDFLIHYGVKGMRHGRRRWQNEDGSYTEAGKVHYGIGDGERKSGSPKESSKKSQSDDSEYLTMQNGKKIAMEPYGIYKYMSSGKQVGRNIKDEASASKDAAKEMKKTDPDLSAMMKESNKQMRALAKKYGKMKYKDINFKEMKRQIDAADDIYYKALTEYTRRHWGE